MPRIVTTLALATLLATARAQDVAFQNVNVVPMDRERVLENQTVLVRNGHIAAVGDPVLPEGTVRIKAPGRYLIPGLADMHVHNWYEEEHVLFLANGVTRIRNLWGTALHLKWRKEIESGKRLGPRLHTTGPILDGEQPIWQRSRIVRTPEEAKRIVREIKALGYESVKVYNKLKKDVYIAIVREARAQGMRVVGHVPWTTGIAGAFRQKQDCIEHLDGYCAWPYKYDADFMLRCVAWTKRQGIWNCPTLVVMQKFVPAERAAQFLGRPEMRYVPPRLLATWEPGRDFRTKKLTAEQFRIIEDGDAVRMRVTRELHEACNRILLGTDCGNPFVVAGWSVHEELQNLVKAGLTPYEALECATKKPAEYLKVSGGVVKEGAPADLVLLDRNPLEDIRNTSRPLGVMVAGRWLPRRKLDAMLDEVEASYKRPKQRFEDFPDLPEGDSRHFRVKWNGLVVGEERFVVQGNTITAQQANDPPWSTRKFMRLEVSDTGFVEKLHAKQSDVFGSREETVAGKAGVQHGYPVLAAWVATIRSLGEIPVGKERAFAYHELVLDKAPEVRAVPVRLHRKSEREYVVAMAYEDATYESRLTVDEKGWPSHLETELQQGTIVFELVAKK